MLQRNRAAWAEESSRARKRDAAMENSKACQSDAALENAASAGGARKRTAEEDADGAKPTAKKKRKPRSAKGAARRKVKYAKHFGYLGKALSPVPD